MRNNSDLPSGLWSGERVFIIGGGFSLIEQFNIPYELYKEVDQGNVPVKALTPYLSDLWDKRVIGINRAYELGEWVDAIYFYDCSFYNHYRTLLDRFGGLKFSSCSRFINNKSRGIRYIPIDRDSKTGISGKSDHIHFNFSSGGAAVDLATKLGASEIVLVGFDMCNGSNQETHWHGGYKEKEEPIRQEAKRKNKLYQKKMPHKRHSKPWRALLRDTQKKGVELANSSYRTAINEIPQVGLGEYL
mgnify:CR=1 FL=1